MSHVGIRAAAPARHAVKPLAAAADLFDRQPPGVTILAYHRVGAGTTSQVDLPADLFAAQLAELAAGHRVLALDDALTVFRGAAPRPAGPAVVVTFDDGTADFVDQAVPRLVEHGVPATLYLATSFVEHGRPFWGHGTPLTWSALAEAVSTGLVQIGSHTHSHALLDRLAPDTIGDELDRSIDLIGDRLGCRATHFAYPKALPPSPRAAAEVAARFESAALAGTRSNPWDRTDPQRLNRSPVQRSDGMRWWRRKARGGMGLEDRARELLNRRRYATLRT